MIKKLFLPVFGAVLLLFSSCTKEYYLQEQRYVTEVNGSTFINYEYTVNAQDWQTEDGINYYYATFVNNEITQQVEDYGAVIAYVWSDGRWNQLPFVYPYYSASEDATWGENIRFDWKKGEVSFILQDLDGGLPEGIENINQMFFKVCIIY